MEKTQYADIENLFKMGILNPYSEGNWITLKPNENESLFPSSSFSVEEDSSIENFYEELNTAPDRILRGPVWDYGLRRASKGSMVLELLFGKSRTPLLTQDELVVKGDKWIPSHLSSYSLASLLLKRFCKADPEATALLEIETGRNLKFKKMIQLVKSLASGLRWIGISPGQVVAIASYNSIEAQLMILASLLVGATVAPVDPSLSPADIGTLLRIVKPRLVFSECGNTLVKVEVALSYLMELRVPHLVVNVYKHMQLDAHSKHFKFKELLREVDAHFKTTFKHSNPDNPVFILFTSGTTDTPKGALITEKFFLNSNKFMESVMPVASDHYTMLMSAPLIWVSMVTSMLVHLADGHRIVFFRGPASEAVLMSALKKFQVLFWVTGPATLMSLLAWPAKPRCNSLRTVVVTGMPFSAENTIRVRDHLFPGKVNVLQIYGMTETGILTFCTPLLNKPGSAGRVFYNVEMKVVEFETGICLGPFEEGELCFKSDFMMQGYYGNPNATEETFDESGFFHTGDKGYYDEQEFVFITGRIKDLIKWKSYQITPSEVEAKLLSEPAVKECQVFGIYNEYENQLVTAAIVLNPGFEYANINMLLKIVNEKLSNSKKIRGGIHVFKELPCTLTGKPIKALIIKEVTERTNNLVHRDS